MIRSGLAALAALAVFAHPASAAELFYEATANGVRALDDAGAVVWENTHGAPRSYGGEILGPFQSDGSVLYVYRSNAFVVDALTGRTRRRVALPDAATGAEFDENGTLKITVGGTEYLSDWQREYHVTAGSDDVPFMFPSSSMFDGTLMRSTAVRLFADIALADADVDARELLEDFDERIDTPEVSTRLPAALAQLDVAARRDPSNPWYRFLIGRIQYAQGLRDTAVSVWTRMLELDHKYRVDLLQISFWLEDLDPALGERGFQAGLDMLLDVGYVPRMQSGLFGPMIYYGRLEETSERSLERLMVHGERIWALAPFAEGAAFFYHGLALSFEEAGDAEAAALWASRADAARPYSYFLASGARGGELGLAMNVMFASLLALPLILLVVVLRRWRPAQEDEASWYSRFGHSMPTRMELIGMLILVPIVMVAASVVTSEVSGIGRAASAPLGVANGFPGHPVVQHFWSSDEMSRTPEGLFMYGLSLHMAGEHDAAIDAYRASGLPEADQNTQHILDARGIAGPTMDPDDIALPDWELMHAAWQVDEGDLWRIPDEAADVIAPGVGVMFWFAIAIGLGTAVGIIWDLVRGHPATQGAGLPSRIGDVAGWILPGTSRHYGVFGPAVLTFTLMSLLVFLILAKTNGQFTNMLEAIATPDFGNYYGTGAYLEVPIDAAMRSIEHLWWILILANIGLHIATGEWKRFVRSG